MQCSPNLYPSDGKVISMLAFGYQRGSAAVASSVMTTGIIYLSWLSDNLPTRQAVRSKHHVASTSDQLWFLSTHCGSLSLRNPSWLYLRRIIGNATRRSLGAR